MKVRIVIATARCREPCTAWDGNPPAPHESVSILLSAQRWMYWCVRLASAALCAIKMCWEWDSGRAPNEDDSLAADHWGLLRCRRTQRKCSATQRIPNANATQRMETVRSNAWPTFAWTCVTYHDGMRCANRKIKIERSMLLFLVCFGDLQRALLFLATELCFIL